MRADRRSAKRAKYPRGTHFSTRFDMECVVDMLPGGVSHLDVGARPKLLQPSKQASAGAAAHVSRTRNGYHKGVPGG